MALEVDRCLGGRLPFAHVVPNWQLRVQRPEVDRFEYQLRLFVAGLDETCTDPGNPLVVPGPFGAKSEIRFPGYAEPRWLSSSARGTQVQLLVAGPLGVEVPVKLWTPPTLAPDQPAPLLVVHDGTDLATRGRLLDWTTTLDRPVRVALLDPAAGTRNDWYAANAAYSTHIAVHVLPALRQRVAVSSTVGLGTSLGAVAMLGVHQESPLDALALQSGSFFRPEIDQQESGWPEFPRVCAAVRRWTADAGRPVPTSVSVGTVEENRGNNELMAEALRQQGFSVTYDVFRDAHNLIGWRDTWFPLLNRLLRQMP